MRRKPVYDVIIVGAGLTGLSAARELKTTMPSARVKLLEGRDQVGGRIRARSMKTTEGDTLMDTGSHFISPSASALVSLANELGLSLFTQANCGMRTLDIRAKRRMELESLTTRRPFRDVLTSAQVNSYANERVHDYLLRTGQTKTVMDTSNRLLQTLFDAPDHTASILHLMLAAASENASVADLLSRYGHGQSLIMQGGLHRLTSWDAAAEHVGNRAWRAVDVPNKSAARNFGPGGVATVTVKTTKQTYVARQVIVTAPPAVVPSIQFTPPLPSDYAKFIGSYRPTGRAYYFTMTFATPFWRGTGRNGQLIHTDARGPIVWLTTFDVGQPTMCSGQGAPGELWGIAHFLNDTASELRRTAYIQVVSQSLGVGGPPPLDVRQDYLVQLEHSLNNYTSEESFTTDPFAYGSIAVLPPNINVAHLDYLKGVNAHAEHVLFASAEFSNISMGLMNGAILSGRQAAADAAARLQGALEPGRDDNEIANLVRLSDDVEQAAQRILLETIEAKQFSDNATSTPFPFSTSTHYPVTPLVEATTFKHFSFGNLGDEEDVTNAVQENETKENAGIDTATERSSFVYQTSSVNPQIDPLDTSTFKHFSFGNSDPAPSRPQNDDVSSAVSGDIVQKLKEVAEKAPTLSSLELATQLSSILQRVLLSMQEEKR
ncbi:unnamed protein product [Heligmosomoides polygyrus]|uniref:Amine oxidase n=1 Tax=Heligmosomoides polygyrus TaxID=6339 RepID=A0A3P7YT26_HELPZ|nr:unnamed protein product [Heligmosomoides polygyrus]